jgi:ABC-2 type transport system ATP-binding protein
MTTPAVRLEHITKRQGRFELGPLDFEVPTGAIYALVGPNGAGKSTLIDLLVGIGRPDRGRIQLLGMDLEQDEVSIKRRVAYFSPDLQYQAWINVGRAIDFVSGFYPDWDSSRCERLLVEFGLSRDEPVAPLSFGARTKLALTMVLSRNSTNRRPGLMQLPNRCFSGSS